jgi:tRNA U34 5-methylaminomethyl-2-thiouridine-forming methyltransferase MnmC
MNTRQRSTSPHTPSLPGIVDTADGSKTLFCPQYQQTYHSIHGALTESRHVFVQGSELVSKLAMSNDLRILEIGFGTGLNYLLTVQVAEQAGVSLHYSALERNILPSPLLEKLDYGALLDRTAHSKLLLRHLSDSSFATGYQVPVFSYENTSLYLYKNLDSLFSDCGADFDIVYHDGFSPERNSELWSDDVIGDLYTRLKDGGTLATYSAKGDVRRAMLRAGFLVRRLPGPPGKREILVGVK